MERITVNAMIRPYDFAEVQRRVREQLSALGQPAISSLAEQYGLGKDYIRDIIAEKPRKKKIGADKLSLLAAALGCDAEYLTLTQNEPRRVSDQASTDVIKSEVSVKQVLVAEFIGFLDSRAWLSPGHIVPIPAAYTEAVAQQRGGRPRLIAIMRGDDMGGARLFDGMMVAAWPHPGGHLDEGSVVIARWRRDELVKLSACEVHHQGARTVLRTHPINRPPEVTREAKGDAEILGVITLAIQVF